MGVVKIYLAMHQNETQINGDRAMSAMKRCGWVVVHYGLIYEFTMSRTKTEAIKAFNDSRSDECDQYKARRRRGAAYLIPVYYNPEDIA